MEFKANPTFPFLRLTSKGRAVTTAFDKYSNVDPYFISAGECSKAVSELEADLIEMGKKTGATEVDEDGSPLSFDEDGFEFEIDTLKSFSYQLSFSDTLYDWIERCRAEILQKLREEFHGQDPGRQLRQQWKLANDPWRRARIIEDVLALQTRVYSGEEMGIAFPAPCVQVIRDKNSLQRNISGSADANLESMLKGSAPIVEIAPRLLARGNVIQDAFATGHHEEIHCVLAYLAVAHEKGLIKAHHPLYEDALMMREKKRHDAVISSVIYSAYRAQPEEEICHEQDGIFEYELFR